MANVMNCKRESAVIAGCTGVCLSLLDGVEYHTSCTVVANFGSQSPENSC